MTITHKGCVINLEQKNDKKKNTKHNARVIYPEKITDRDREEAQKLLIQDKNFKIIERLFLKYG